jgi:hypothetical protein
MYTEVFKTDWCWGFNNGTLFHFNLRPRAKLLMYVAGYLGLAKYQSEYFLLVERGRISSSVLSN